MGRSTEECELSPQREVECARPVVGHGRPDQGALGLTDAPPATTLSGHPLRTRR
jgi:hypothetical protein